jgi:hypothetical protein
LHSPLDIAQRVDLVGKKFHVSTTGLYSAQASSEWTKIFHQFTFRTALSLLPKHER